MKKIPASGQTPNMRVNKIRRSKRARRGWGGKKESEVNGNIPKLIILRWSSFP